MPNLVNSVDILAVRHVKQGIEAERFRAVQPLVQVTYITPTIQTQGNIFPDAPLYILLLRFWFGYVPNLVNSVDILAVRHVKQGIEAERFRAVQPLVQVTYITLHYISTLESFSGERKIGADQHC